MGVALARKNIPKTEGAFDRLLVDIVGGRYPAGANLPPERELARRLGASRPTLREALRRLGEWRLIEARRGSGVVVRDRREWSLDALPAFLRHGAAGLGPEGLAALIADLLALRRATLVELLRVVGGRIDRAAIDEARARFAHAWAARANVAAFVREDLAATRALVEGAGFLPAVWLLNGFGGVLEEIARTLSGAAAPPPDYPAAWSAILDALARRRTARACRTLADYLTRHDRRLLAALGIQPS